MSDVKTENRTDSDCNPSSVLFSIASFKSGIVSFSEFVFPHLFLEARLLCAGQDSWLSAVCCANPDQ